MCTKEIEKRIVDILLCSLTILIALFIIILTTVAAYSYEKTAVLLFFTVSVVFFIILTIIRLKEHGKPDWLEYCINTHCKDTQEQNETLLNI
jgi:hypothetical protein